MGEEQKKRKNQKKKQQRKSKKEQGKRDREFGECLLEEEFKQVSDEEENDRLYT